MLSSMPIDKNDSKIKVVRFVGSRGEPTISQDVNAGQFFPAQLDRDNTNFRMVSACNVWPAVSKFV